MAFRESRDRSLHREPEDLVFPNGKGEPYREEGLLQRILQPAGETAGVGRVTFHQLRHTHASLLHDMGVPAKIAQEQLGHATVETTLKVYTHTIPETHRKAVEGLERVLFPNVPKLARPHEESGDCKSVIQKEKVGGAGENRTPA